MLSICGFRKVNTGGCCPYAHYQVIPKYRGCTFVLYGRDGSALGKDIKIPLALVSLQSKNIDNHGELVHGKIQTDNRQMKKYTYMFDEEQADLEIVYANLLPEGSGDMKFVFRLEPSNTGRPDKLLNEISILRGGQSYMMKSSALGPDPNNFTSIRIKTKDFLLRTMDRTPRDKLTNLEKYENIKQHLVFNVIPDVSTSKYFTCGLDLVLQDSFDVCVQKCAKTNWAYDEPDNEWDVDNNITTRHFFKDCAPSMVESDGGPSRQYDEVDGGASCLNSINLPKNQQHLAEVTAGERKHRPRSLSVKFNGAHEFALGMVRITLTGTDISDKCTDYTTPY